MLVYKIWFSLPLEMPEVEGQRLCHKMTASKEMVCFLVHTPLPSLIKSSLDALI